VKTTTIGPLTVSRLALGAMLMGGKTPRDEAERILDRFLAAGGNLVDTADVDEDGGSERALAPWLARHRDDIVLSTKVRFEVSDPGGAGLAPDRIRAACDASLRRLGTDVIDLYQVHAPDAAVPIEATLEAAGRRGGVGTDPRGPHAASIRRAPGRGRDRAQRRRAGRPGSTGAPAADLSAADAARADRDRRPASSASDVGDAVRAVAV
jgi:Aldo/keto reductase family